MKTIRFFFSKSQFVSIINPDFDFKTMGIGGLDAEFNAIFRRAFASRVFPPEVVYQLGEFLFPIPEKVFNIDSFRNETLPWNSPVRSTWYWKNIDGSVNILSNNHWIIYPFRQIGKMLNAREPKIVNGPQILDKYVGESEANVRKLFADAEEEEKRV